MGEVIVSKNLVTAGIPVFSADTKSHPWGYVPTSKRVYSPETIILSARGTIGHPRYPKLEKCTSTQTTIAVVPHRNIDSAYLYSWLLALDFSPYTSVQAVPMLTVKDVRSFRVPLPSLILQKRIAKEVNVLLERVRIQGMIEEHYSTLWDGLRRHLLYF